MRYRIGTRGSKLALAQSGVVKDHLARLYPQDEFELVVVTTTGDRSATTPLNQLGQTGVFVKEIEEQLLAGEIDLAIHSMKDMATKMPEALALIPYGKREDQRDVLILREAKSLADLKNGATIGTGSPRRSYQLRKLRSDLKVMGIRGNIETRIKKMHELGLDGIVLAAAGLKRLGLEGVITEYLSETQMLPAPAQGVLGLQYKKERTDVKSLLDPLRDETLEELVAAERGFLTLTNAGCHQPIGAFASYEADTVRLDILYGNEDESAMFSDTFFGKTAAEAANQAYLAVKERITV